MTQQDTAFIDGKHVTQACNTLPTLEDALKTTTTDPYIPADTLLANTDTTGNGNGVNIQAETTCTRSDYHNHVTTPAFKTLQQTNFNKYIEHVTDWGRLTNIERIHITGNVHPSTDTHTDTQHTGSIVVSLYPTEQNPSPYTINVTFHVDTAPFIELQLTPTYYQTADAEELYWKLSDFTASAAIHALESKRPYCASRVSELITELDCTESHAKTQALREAGLTHDEIATRLDISTNASTSYTSKINTVAETGFIRAIALGAPPRRYVSSTEFPTQTRGHTQTRYVFKDIETNDGYLVTRDEYTHMHPDASLRGTTTTTTNRYDSITALFKSEIQTNATQQSDAWDTLIRETEQSMLTTTKTDLLNAE